MRRKEKAPQSIVIKMAVAALAVTALVFGYPVIGPLLEDVLGRAAIFSTALTMPEGAALTLQQRYAPDIYAPDGLSPESQPPSSPESRDPSPGEDPDDPDQPGENRWQGEAADIPEEYRGVLMEVNISGEDTSSFYQYNAGWIRNYTSLTSGEIEEVLGTPYRGTLTPSAEPQILIYHTHATESYELFDAPWYDVRNTWRSTDNTNNMVAVGKALKEALEAQGFAVIHDTTQHDYPSYNGSYERSRATVEGYLKKYPSITVLLDIHRDAILYDDDSIAKPVVEVDGRKAAQVMLVSSCDDGSVGVPGWRDNLRFAAALDAAIQERYPGLTRPVFFAYRHYNQDLSPQTLLLEFGSNGNTLEEAVYAARLMGPVVADVLQNG